MAFIQQKKIKISTMAYMRRILDLKEKILIKLICNQWGIMGLFGTILCVKNIFFFIKREPILKVFLQLLQIRKMKIKKK